MMAKRNVQGRQTARESQDAKVQKQIKALQKRIRELEYDVIWLKTQVKPVNEVRHIGFIQHNNLRSDNAFDNGE